MEPKQLGRARCPYCEKKVNLMVAWGLRRRGEYRCPRCNGISNVTHSRLLLPLALCAIGVSGLILLLTLFLLEPATGWSVLLVLAPFLVFYIFSLFCVQLKKPVIRREMLLRSLLRKSPVAPKPGKRWTRPGFCKGELEPFGPNGFGRFAKGQNRP